MPYQRHPVNHPCKYDQHHIESVYYLVYGCDNLHVADTTVCRKHLDQTKICYQQQTLRCVTCNQLIASGRYQKINPGNTMRITTYDLNGNKITSTINPDYTPYAAGGIIKDIKSATQATSQLTQQTIETLKYTSEWVKYIQEHRNK